MELCAGVDEVGRGCLAGPVVACAVLLPVDFHLPGLADSKLLRPNSRKMLDKEIKACAVSLGLGLVRAKRIDHINILQATFEAMGRAVAKLSCAPTLLCIDGNKTIPEAILRTFWSKKHLENLPLQQAIVDGDATIPSISAASIVAKTFRDRLMERFDKIWPEYGFAQHKGYGTKQHFEALRRFGPCPLHRLTFRGVLPN